MERNSQRPTMSRYASRTFQRNQYQGFLPCLTCAKPFNSITALEHHQEDAYHFIGPYGGLWSRRDFQHKYLQAFYEYHAMVLRNDQRISRQIVQEKLGEIRELFDRYDDELDFYSFKIEPAGSTATGTKVFQADEFDFNIGIESRCFRLSNERIKIGFVQNNYNYRKYLQRPSSFAYVRNGERPPPGYIAIRYNLAVPECRNTNWSFGGYIVPKLVQEDLYNKIDTALESDLDPDVTISGVAHGPAITVTIHKPKYTDAHHTSHVTHDISIDFAAALEINRTPSYYHWPRLDTESCLLPQKISLVQNTKLCLVPKHNLFWYVSFSRPAKVLLRCIDSANTCRRKCHKILKADFKKWQSEQSYDGISTFIFKNHLFWFNEEKGTMLNDLESFWDESNIVECYIQLLEDLASKLEDGHLSNYFNPDENILENKSFDVLQQLSDRITRRVEELESMEVYVY